jgi:hypothetical protein
MMIVIARGAARGGYGACPPDAPSGPPRAGARERCATQRGEGRAVGAPRAQRNGRRGHHTAGDGAAMRTEEGAEGEAGPADVERLQQDVGEVREGGTAGRSPPPVGAGEGGRRGDEEGGAPWRGRERERERKSRGRGRARGRRVMAGLYM